MIIVYSQVARIAYKINIVKQKSMIYNYITYVAILFLIFIKNSIGLYVNVLFNSYYTPCNATTEYACRITKHVITPIKYCGMHFYA